MIDEKTKKSLVMIALLVIAAALPVIARQEQQKEFVQVVNVELMLRVLKDGLPVAGLKKSDFSLYEDGEKSEINGFVEVRRRLAHEGEARKERQQPRLYLLFFWVGNPAADVEGALDKFFASIYREGDRVILGTPLKTFELSAPQDKAGVSAAFLAQLRQEAKDRLSRTLQLQEELNRLLEDLVNRLYEQIAKAVAKAKNAGALNMENASAIEDSGNGGKEITSFIGQYARMVQEYRLRELTPDMSAFEAMARSMAPARNDKFALVFFQRDALPLFDIANVRGLCMTRQIPENIAGQLTDALLRIEEQEKKRLDVHGFSEQLKLLFIQANMQFHLLSLSPYKIDGRANANTFFALTKSEEVYSKWDQVMHEISRNTGGLSLDGDHMLDALERVIAFEDIYYLITYVPRGQGAAKRKLDIRVGQPGMQVIHGRTVEVQELPLVKITDMSVSSQLIYLGVADFYPIAKDGVSTGFVRIDVSGRQTDKEPPRLLASQESETVGTIEMPIAFPQPGLWDVEARVVDLITGQQDVRRAKVEIAADVPAAALNRESDRALGTLLARAAAYAEKLKKSAFHFICRESVTENAFVPKSSKNPMPLTMRNYWIYDYQIIARDGKISENRILLEKNQEKLHREKAQLETMFQSYFSFYMPVTLLAREKQHLYQYRLLGQEKINDQNVLHVSALRRFPGSIPWGELWLREEDGVILKIHIDQTSIVRFQKLAQKAIDEGFLPEITTVHEYSLEKNGICFPSRTTFVERYISYGETPGRDNPSGERSRTYFEYNDYQFFSVSTRVAEKTE